MKYLNLLFCISLSACSITDSKPFASVDDFVFKVKKTPATGKFDELIIVKGGDSQSLKLADLKLFEAQRLEQLNGDAATAFYNLEDSAKPFGGGEFVNSLGEKILFDHGDDLVEIKPLASATQGAIFLFEVNGEKKIFKFFMNCFPECGPEMVLEEKKLSTVLKKFVPEFGTRTYGIRYHKIGVVKDFVAGETFYKVLVDQTLDSQHINRLIEVNYRVSLAGLKIRDMNPGNLMFTKDGIKIIDGEVNAVTLDLKAAQKYNHDSMTSKLFEGKWLTWVKKTFLNRGHNTPAITELMHWKMLQEFIPRLHSDTWPDDWMSLGNSCS